MFRDKLKKNEKTVGMIVHLNDVGVARIAALAGYDFVWVDLEHSSMSFETLLADISVIKASGAAVIVRVPQNDLTYTKKVLEMGVDGIIFPMIRSASEANEQISWTLYPPYGTRGFGPIGAVDYGFGDSKKYVDGTRDELCRFIQIEHIDAVEELDAIMDNEYIDGYIFGPNDLSGSLGEMLDVFGDKTLSVIRSVMDRLEARGKYTGLATGDVSDGTLRRWSGMGVKMLAAGVDYCLLKDAALENRRKLDRIHRNGE